MEVHITNGLLPCTADEKRLPLRLWGQLQTYRLPTCPHEDPLPQCSVTVATQCLQLFTALMDTQDVEDELICR